MILALATTVRVLGLVNVNINVLKYFKVKNLVDTTKSLRNEYLSNLSCSIILKDQHISMFFVV